MTGKLAQIREAIAKCFEVTAQPRTKGEAISWINQHYALAGFNPGTLDQQLYRSCVNVKSAIKSSAPKIIFYDKNSKIYRRSTELERQEFDRLYRNSEISESEAAGDEPEVNTTFALEAHLQGYLARNLSVIEKGLTLWTDEISGSIEYPVEGRRIDILAKDSQGVPVVIELKLSRGHEKTLGQALYYRAKLKQLLKVERIRIIMIAAEVSNELRIASTEVKDVDIFSYALTMQLEKIKQH